MTSYSIRSSHNNVELLVGWDLYASKDYEHWSLIDRRYNQTEMRQRLKTCHYSCLEGTYRYFMIRNATSTSNNKYIVFAQLEYLNFTLTAIMEQIQQ